MIKLEKVVLAVDGGYYYPQSVELKQDYGLVGDRFAGDAERQICLLDMDVSNAIKELDGLCTKKFIGNFLTTGLDYKTLEVGQKLKVGKAQIEIVQRGKKCYPECPLITANSQCDLPRSCAFAKVIKGATIKMGSEMTIEEKE